MAQLAQTFGRMGFINSFFFFCSLIRFRYLLRFNEKHQVPAHVQNVLVCTPARPTSQDPAPYLIVPQYTR